MCRYITSFSRGVILKLILSPQTITAIQQLRARPVRTLSSPPSSHQPTRLNTTSTQSLITPTTPALLNVSDKYMHNLQRRVHFTAYSVSPSQSITYRDASNDPIVADCRSGQYD